VTRTDVAFPAADGTTLRGWWYEPVTPGPWPVVVMAHGFSAVKEMGLDRVAAALADAGCAVQVHDHRNLGASDGEPRGCVDIWAQARDYRAAIDAALARPGVDADRLALWGSSYSGGEVLVVGAADDRVRAVVAQVPFAGLPDADPDPDGTRWAVLRDALLAGTRGEAADPIGPLPVVAATADQPVVLGQPEAWEWFSAMGAGTSWRNEVTLARDGGPVPFDPGLAVAHLAPRPLLMIVATDDRLAATDIALASFERAAEPKGLLLLEGHHFVCYDGDGFDRSVGATVAFLARHLDAHPGGAA
jgi:hypothetical protein